METFATPATSKDGVQMPPTAFGQTVRMKWEPSVKSSTVNCVVEGPTEVQTTCLRWPDSANVFVCHLRVGAARGEYTGEPGAYMLDSPARGTLSGREQKTQLQIHLPSPSNGTGLEAKARTATCCSRYCVCV